MQSLYESQVEAIMKGVGVSAGSKLYGVMPGDSVRVKATIQFRGPAYSDTFYAAIGNYAVAFDEIWVGSVAVNFQQSYDWVTYELTVDIPITKVANFPWTPGWFDIYAKLTKAGVLTPRLDNMIEVLLAPEFQNFVLTDYSKV
jgi:hypothetical protein